MEIHGQTAIHHPRKRVYEAYRDHLPEIADYIAEVERIEVASREQLPGGVKLHNVWHARARMPRVARAFIRPEMLCWDDHAHWQDRRFVCDWELRTRFFRDNVRCSGQSLFETDGRGACRVLLRGDLSIDLRDIGAVPGLLKGSVARQIERFVVALIAPNLTRVNQAVESFMDAER